ncbi:hypothetical protein ACFWV1_14340 [Streptomyces sp. NPDC058700]|uniref:hypothetical protein n=1 Tax=unclassified Streptomyces TaxID=2593676 RepID=UPI003656A13D
MSERMNERGHDSGNERGREPAEHASDGDDVMRQSTPSQAEGERGKEEDEEQQPKRGHGV